MSARSQLRKLAPLLDSGQDEGRLAVLQNLDMLAEMALEHHEVRMSEGSEYEIPKPDFGTAIRCQEFGAKVLGIGPRTRRASGGRRSSAEIVQHLEEYLMAVVEDGGARQLDAARLILEQRGLLVKKQLNADADLSDATREQLGARLERVLALGGISEAE